MLRLGAFSCRVGRGGAASIRAARLASRLASRLANGDSQTQPAPHGIGVVDILVAAVERQWRVIGWRRRRSIPLVCREVHVPCLCEDGTQSNADMGNHPRTGCGEVTVKVKGHDSCREVSDRDSDIGDH